MGTADELDRLDVAGKIVVTEGSIGGVTSAAVRRAGCVGCREYRQRPAELRSAPDSLERDSGRGAAAVRPSSDSSFRPGKRRC